jgi:hypothetical protein
MGKFLKVISSQNEGAKKFKTLSEVQKPDFTLIFWIF